MTTTFSSIFERGYQALESESLDGVRAAMDEAVTAGVAKDDPRLGYLEFMAVWLDQESSDTDLEVQIAAATDLLEHGARFEDPIEAARICLNVSDLLTQAGEFDDAEHALRALSEREDVSADSLGAACLMRATILLDHHEDPDEALAVLQTAPAELREQASYLSIRAATLLDLDRADEAIELLEGAVKLHDDIELRYQLGVALRENDREAEAIEHLLEVRRRDIADYEVDVSEPVDADEIEDLRRRVEDVLDTLPDPVIAKVASAPIRVERWASEDAIRAGVDPRSPVAFTGEPGEDDEDGEVEALIVYRDAIVAQIDEDDEIVDVIALGLVEEFDRFFALELVPGM